MVLSLFSNKSIMIGLAIAGVTFVLIIVIVIMLLAQQKKKKCYRVLDRIRARIVNLKQNDAIKNYSTYDHLKNDEKLGLLVMRWKKSIEILVREIDAQFNLVDVLENAIESRKFKNFYSLSAQVEKDVASLDDRANELNDEIAEYINQASDNRKYIHKYQEMFDELVQKYIENGNHFIRVKDKLNKKVDSIKAQFELCQDQIQNSRFSEADQTASEVFEAIKVFDRILDEVPKFFKHLNEEIEPKYQSFLELFNLFTPEELEMLEETLVEQATRYQLLKQEVENNLLSLKLKTVKDDLIQLENFYERYNKVLEVERSNKLTIIDQINYQKEYIKKVENSAKNFIGLFKIVQISYDEKDIHQIENILVSIERLKGELNQLEEDFTMRTTPFDTIKGKLDLSYKQLTDISNMLDQKIKIIDSIYSDEKVAREKLKKLTEKINGTKKFIKVANLSDKVSDLKEITDLNAQLTEIYVLLSDFPIDIMKLNEQIDEMSNKVEEKTKTMNNKLYKALLTEYAILYGNRYYNNKEYRQEIFSAETAFNQKDYKKANEKIMGIYDRINPQIKREILTGFQEKFQLFFS